MDVYQGGCMVDLKPLLDYYGNRLLRTGSLVTSIVSVEKKDWDVGYYYQLFRDGIIDFHEDLQRFFVWDDVRKSMWIESLILGFPVPPIFLLQDASSKLLIIDGLQRSLTIKEFVENRFAIKYTSIPELQNKRFSELALDIKQRLMRASLPVFIIKMPSSDSENLHKLILIEVFRRLNLGAKRLTLRQLMFITLDTPCIKVAKELARSLEFSRLVMPSNGERNAMYDRWLILGLMASINAGIPLNTSSSGMGTLRVSNTVFSTAINTDETKCADLKRKILELLRTAYSRGFKREDFMPRSYGYGRKKYMSSVLFNFILLTLLNMPRVSRDIIQDFIKRNIRNFVELSRVSDQSRLDDLFNEFRKEILERTTSELFNIRDKLSTIPDEEIAKLIREDRDNR